MPIGDYSYLRRLAVDTQKAKWVAEEKDFQEAVIAFVDVRRQLNEQVASLNQELADHEGQIVKLKRILAEREALLTAVQASFIWKLLTRIQWVRYAKLVKHSGLFEPTYYRSYNPDVAGAGIDPLKHYFVRGAYEGRDPHPLLPRTYYLSQNPHVPRAPANPL